MATPVDEFVHRAEEIYAARLRAILEPEYADQFVAIEPDSWKWYGWPRTSAALRTRDDLMNTSDLPGYGDDIDVW